MNEELIPLQFDKNGNLQYWIDKTDPLWGYSLWTYESKKETGCSQLVTDIPKKFLKHFDGIRLTERYKDAISTTICNLLIK